MTISTVIIILLCLLCFLNFITLLVLSFNLFVSMKTASFLVGMASSIEKRFKRIYQEIEAADEEDDEPDTKGLIDINQVDNYDPRFSPN